MGMVESYIYALDPDEITLEQFSHCLDQPFTLKGALMPDAHSGYVAPIGAVLVTKGYLVPAWVGYDIGCGVSSAQLMGENMLQKIVDNKDAIFAKVKELVPMGMGKINQISALTRETQKRYQEILEKFEKGPYDKSVIQFFKSKAPRHLGSLGDGNHFIEVGKDEEGNAWVTVHSGSRGVGYKVAERYMKKSANDDKNFEATHPLHDESKFGLEYLNILDFGLEFALLNRLEMIRKVNMAISQVLGEEIKFDLWVNKNHNHAIKEGDYYIHRKGATPAKLDERGVIPGNMRDGCFLVQGLGNEKFLNSSSHGAGRKYSRKGAKEKFSMEEFEESMQGIVGTVSQGTLDEAPMAYKNVFDVMDAQKESVKVVKHLTPIINWKGERGMRHSKN